MFKKKRMIWIILFAILLVGCSEDKKYEELASQENQGTHKREMNGETVFEKTSTNGIIHEDKIEKASMDQDTYSIFDNKEGIYKGTVNGILLLKRGDEDNKEKIFTILDFQGSKAELSVERDPYEMYDLCYENYLGYTTSGKSTITYATYASANSLTIRVGDDQYLVSTIDGASIDKVEGIEAKYWTENNIEYLTLKFLKEVELNNIQYLLLKYDGIDPNMKKNQTIDQFVENNIKYAKILPDSLLVFCIKKNEN